MNTQKKFTPGSRLQSVKPAIQGIVYLFRNEPNARIHLLALIAVVVLGIWVDLSRGEWIAIALVSALVIGSELVNTSIEHLSDVVSPTHHEKIGKVKDLAAGAVLVAALAAIVTGLFVFLPYLLD